MAQSDIANKIYEERFEIGIDIVKRVAEKKGLKLSDFEIADIGCRIASSLFIEKNKSFRVGQIERRYEDTPTKEKA